MSLDIRPDHMKIVQDIMSAHVPDREVWAFGSRVTGKATETSDLDLAIIGETPLDFETLAALRDAFSESRIPYKVDVVDWATISETFREIIRKDKLVIQSADTFSRNSLYHVDFPIHWLETTVGQQATLQRGIDITKTEQRPGNIPVISSGGIQSYHDSTQLKGPGVILGRKGVVGSVYYVESDYWPHDTTLWVKNFHGNEPRFVYYFFKKIANELASMDTGSANPTLNRNHVHTINTLWPPLPEQRSIAHILGTLDDKIELNRRMNETLEAMARAIFKSWFVDFDPVRAKAEGRDTGLPKEISDLFPDGFEDSELGEIPRGWRVGAIGEITGFLGGYAFKSNDWIEEGVPVVKIGSVKPGIVDLSSVSFVSEQVAEKAERYRLSSGDLLIGMTGYVGEVGLVPKTNTTPLLNQRVGKFLLETPGTSALAFLYCVTRQSEFKMQVEAKSHGTAQANVSAEGILSIKIVIPPKKLQNEFNLFGKPIIDHILENYAVSNTIVTLRDSLLPKLLSGGIRIVTNDKITEKHD